MHQLLPMFERARSERAPLVLATVVATRGSTYRKAGAQMLIGAGGRYEGILSGGCLEGDLAAHAASVLETGAPKLVRYDNGGDDDLLWGLGAGCEGGMDVWLVRLDPAANWEPFARWRSASSSACGPAMPSCSILRCRPCPLARRFGWRAVRPRRTDLPQPLTDLPGRRTPAPTRSRQLQGSSSATARALRLFVGSARHPRANCC